LFVHGGYWRAFSRQDYSFVAETICGAGAVAAVIARDAGRAGLARAAPRAHVARVRKPASD